MTETAKNRDIEVLRAAAIAYVVFWHLAPHALERLGAAGRSIEASTALWSGVDLFFSVSGFVIASSLLRERDRHTSFRRFAVPFWIRRIFRLWPGAWLWAAIAVVLACTFNSTGLFGVPANTARDAAMAVLNVANFHQLGCLREHTCGALRIYWSLSLEEQFYWVFPFAAYFLGRRPLMVLVAIIAAVQMPLVRPMAFTAASPGLAWLTRTDAICLGVLTAYAASTSAYAAIRASAMRHRFMCGAGAFALLLVLAVAAAPRLQIGRATSILALASGALVLLASFDAGLIFPRVPWAEPVLMWLGSRSYSLYLVHDIAGSLAAELRARVAVPLSGAGFAAYGLALTAGLALVFAETNYRWVESPLRRYGRTLAASQRRSG